jgi:hypothetical protein
VSCEGLTSYVSDHKMGVIAAFTTNSNLLRLYNVRKKDSLGMIHPIDVVHYNHRHYKYLLFTVIVNQRPQ